MNSSNHVLMNRNYPAPNPAINISDIFLEGLGTRTYIQSPYQRSFRYPVHLPQQRASTFPDGPCITVIPNRWAGALVGIHVIYYMLFILESHAACAPSFAKTLSRDNLYYITS